MRTSALLGAKNFGFFEIYGVSARTRRVLPSHWGISSYWTASIFYERALKLISSYFPVSFVFFCQISVYLVLVNFIILLAIVLSEQYFKLLQLKMTLVHCRNFLLH